MAGCLCWWIGNLGNQIGPLLGYSKVKKQATRGTGLLLWLFAAHGSVVAASPASARHLRHSAARAKEEEARFWDSTELVQISAKFVHFGEVQNEFYALHSEISLN
jgi:hypothetical protein